MTNVLTEALKDPSKRPILVTAAVSSITTFGVGCAVGYILGKRQKQFVHAVPAQDWGSENKLPIVEEDPVVSEGKEFVKQHLGVIPRGPDITHVVEDEAVEPVRQSIFSETDDDWDYEKEVESRTDQEPYVIHKDEFYNNEENYTQTTLTYYEGDQILVDEEDTPIYNHTSIVGPMLFGHGSGDPNVFHVRNHKLKAEYEIIRDTGLYSVEVLGLEIQENARASDLEHSRNRKFRQE